MNLFDRALAAILDWEGVVTKLNDPRWACEYLKEKLTNIVLYKGMELQHLNLNRNKGGI